MRDEISTYHMATESYDFCIDEYIAITADAWDANPLAIETGRSGMVGQGWQIGPCLLSSFRTGPFVWETTAAHLQNERPLVALERCLSGIEFCQYPNADLEDYHSPPGEIHICNEAIVERSIGTALQAQEIILPREMIGLSPTRPAGYAVISEESMIGRIIYAEWDAMFAAVYSGQNAFSKQAIDRFSAGVKIALGVPPEREDVRAQARELMRRQIQRHILVNLEKPGLSTGTILNCFGLSRASLYRMFEPLGGIRTYITYLRASKALLEIWDAGLNHGSVTAARERWSFSSGNDFNRTVRRLFGNSPKRLLSGKPPETPYSQTEIAFGHGFRSISRT